MALIEGAASYYGVRAFLGAAEAGFQPGALFFITLWFPEAYRGRVLGLFIAAIPVSGIIGAPLSGFLLSLNGRGGLAGWQWLYILEGIPAILLAPVVLTYLRDSPAEVKWLQPEERTWLVAELTSQKKARESRRTYSFLQSLTNPWVWFLASIYFTNVCLNNAIATFLPQIIKGFGVSNQETGFIAAIPSVVALIAVLWLCLLYTSYAASSRAMCSSSHPVRNCGYDRVSCPGWKAGTIASSAATGRRNVPKLTVWALAASSRNAITSSRPSQERVSCVSTGRARWAATRVSTMDTKWKKTPASAAGTAICRQRGRSYSAAGNTASAAIP